jgi:hypothetical protein
VLNASLISPGVESAPSFATDDGSGVGGSTIDAPPGTKLVEAELNFANTSDRPQPMWFIGLGPLPFPSNSVFTLAVPTPDIAAFGQTTSSTGCADTEAPAGYCSIGAAISAFSPAQEDITQPPQIAAGATGTATLVAGGPGVGIPQNAPLQDVKVFLYGTQACSTCWAPLN